MIMLETLLNDGNRERCIKKWNKKLKKRIGYYDEFDDINDASDLFNSYTNKIKWLKNTSFDDNTVVIIQNDKNFNIYYYKNNEFYYEEISIYSKKKWMSLIFRFTNIITNFSIDMNTWPKNKKYLRYELIRNYYIGNNFHFFSKTSITDINNYTCLLESNLVNEIFNRHLKIGSLLNFSSLLLNHFESGVDLESIILRPKITISNYGRWYFSGSENIQNSKKARDYINNKILSTNKSIIKMDLKSAEPNCLSKFSGSKILPIIIQKRYDNPELSEMIKFVLNSFIHSGNTFDIIYEMVEKKFGSKYTFQNFSNLLENLGALQDEILWYNKRVRKEYTSNLHVHEGIRRIVNPFICLIMGDDYEKEIWKEHLKYLQGHVHDQVIKIAFQIKRKLNILPSYLVHDEIVYTGDYTMIDSLKDSLNESLLKIGMNGTITVLKNKEE